MKNTSVLKIPFDMEGNQKHFPPYNVIWRDNFVFEDTISYDGYSRGRSAAYFHFKGTNDKSMTMFLSDFEDVIPYLNNGKVSGKFTFCKKGQNYGVKMIFDKV